MLRPPCWPEGSKCPNGCARQLYERVIYGKTPLFGPWAGWRMTDKYLISPDGQRITPERLRGLLVQEWLGPGRPGPALADHHTEPIRPDHLTEPICQTSLERREITE